jgi:hypothetical protein
MSSFYTNANKKVLIGEDFTLRVPNSREFILEVNGDFDIDGLKLTIIGTSSLPDPRFKIISYNQIKIFFEEQFFNLGTSYKMTTHCFSNSTVGDIEKEIVTKWDKISGGGKSFMKSVAISVLVLLVGAFYLVLDKKYNNAKLYNLVKAFSMTEVADSIEEGVDTVAITNNHPLYNSSNFIEKQNDISEKVGELVDLKSYYGFVGNGLFAFKQLARIGDNIVITSFSKASAFCEELGARIPTELELKSFTRGKVRDIKGFELRIKDENDVAEWTSTEIEDDSNYYKAYMKNVLKSPPGSKMFGEIVGAHEDDTKLAFRCVMDKGNFL